MTARQQQTGVGQTFTCPGCAHRTSFVGSRYRAGRIRVCADCFVTGRVAPPEPVREPAKVTVLPGYPGRDVRYQPDPREPIVGGFVSEWRTLRGRA